MKIAPIVHTRTFSHDFISGFLARPDYFTSDDIAWARENIQASTYDIDSLQGERYVVIDNGKIRIAGIVILNVDLARKANKIEIPKKYFYDDKGRTIYAFIGICIQEPESINNLDYNSFAEIFKKYVIPVFDEKAVQTQQVHAEMEAKSTTLSAKPADKGIQIGSSTVYESNPVLDKEHFLYFLNTKDTNFTFCSNIYDYKMVQSGTFNYLTTNPNNIERLKMDMSKITENQAKQKEQEYQQFKETYKTELLSDTSIFDEILNNNESCKYFKEKLKPYFKEKLIDDDELFVEIAQEKLNKQGSTNDTWLKQFKAIIASVISILTIGNIILLLKKDKEPKKDKNQKNKPS